MNETGEGNALAFKSFWENDRNTHVLQQSAEVAPTES